MNPLYTALPIVIQRAAPHSGHLHNEPCVLQHMDLGDHSKLDLQGTWLKLEARDGRGTSGVGMGFGAHLMKFSRATRLSSWPSSFFPLTLGTTVNVRFGLKKLTCKAGTGVGLEKEKKRRGKL